MARHHSRGPRPQPPGTKELWYRTHLTLPPNSRDLSLSLVTSNLSDPGDYAGCPQFFVNGTLVGQVRGFPGCFGTRSDIHLYAFPTRRSSLRRARRGRPFRLQSPRPRSGTRRLVFLSRPPRPRTLASCFKTSATSSTSATTARTLSARSSSASSSSSSSPSPSTCARPPSTASSSSSCSRPARQYPHLRHLPPSVRSRHAFHLLSTPPAPSQAFQSHIASRSSSASSCGFADPALLSLTLSSSTALCLLEIVAFTNHNVSNASGELHLAWQLPA